MAPFNRRQDRENGSGKLRCVLIILVAMTTLTLYVSVHHSTSTTSTALSDFSPPLQQEKPWSMKSDKVQQELNLLRGDLKSAQQALHEQSSSSKRQADLAQQSLASLEQQMQQAQQKQEEETKKTLELQQELTRLKEQLQSSKTAAESTPPKKRKKKRKKPLNILLLYADDMRYDSLGSASNGFIKTPFFDELAKEGMRFTHNCVTTSVCWVSRATLYTGQYVSRHKSTEPMKPGFYEGWNQTFPHLLRENGYYYGHVGKWHFKDYFEFVKPKFDWEKMYYGFHWETFGGKRKHSTKMNEEDAIQFLQERPKDKPFFLSVCFFTPHADDGKPEQYMPQNESMSLYADDTVPIAPSATEEAWQKMPHFFGKINEGRNRYFWRFDTPEKYQKMMKNYYRLISEIDATSEKIVGELKSQGLYDDTLIIFTTDNGYFHAEHGLADKWYPYQESIRVPLIIRDPRMARDNVGKLNDEFTLSIDLAPTILEAAGIEAPDVMHGRDMSVLYTSESLEESWRDEFFYEHPVHLREDIIPASEALVRKDYKYMLWPNYNVEQFFDLKNDTYELNDLINSTRHQKLIGEMRTRFEELKQAAK